MQKLARTAAVVVLLGGALVGATPAIAPQALLGHIRFLASDELRGRGNGTKELEQAGAYIAAQFEAAGLRPGGRGGGWFQPFELNVGLTVGPRNLLEVEGNGASVQLALGE